MDGLVLYNPSEEETVTIREIVERIESSKPDIVAIAKRHMVTSMFITRIDWDAISREVDSPKYFGWEMFGEVYTMKRAWANAVINIYEMLKINTECFISPKYAKGLCEAMLAYKDLPK